MVIGKREKKNPLSGQLEEWEGLIFVYMDANKPVQTVIILSSYQRGHVYHPNTCPCYSQEMSHVCFPEHDHPFTT